MKLSFKKKYRKKYVVLPTKIKIKVGDTLEIFVSNPFATELRNHALRGEYEGFRSIDVTGDYRIIFRELSEGRYEFVELIDVGTHSQLYL